MATRSDILLAQAMSQLGAGFGSMMGRRRQTKRDNEFINKYAQMTTPEQFQDSPEAQLIGALTGAGMGMAGVRGTGMGGEANRQMASAQSAGANKQSELLRAMLKGDPQAVAMMKQGMIQQQIASGMPQKPMSVTGGYLDANGKFVRTADKPPQDFSKNFKVEQIGNEDVLAHYTEDGREEISRAPRGSYSPMTIKAGKDKNGVDLEQVGVLNKFTGEFTPEGPSGTAGSSNITTKDSAALTTPKLGATQEKIMTVDSSMTAYNNIMDTFKKKYLTWPDQLWRVVQSGVDKAGFSKILPDESWDEYKQATTFKQNVWTSVNTYIKAITGAQMSEKEVPRILKSIANTADSPEAFEAKMEQSMRAAQETRTRMEEYISSGVVPDGYESVVVESYNKYKDVYNHDEAVRLAERDATQKWADNQIVTSLTSIEDGYGEEDSEGGGGLLPGSRIISGGGR